MCRIILQQVPAPDTDAKPKPPTEKAVPDKIMEARGSCGSETAAVVATGGHWKGYGRRAARSLRVFSKLTSVHDGYADSSPSPCLSSSWARRTWRQPPRLGTNNVAAMVDWGQVGAVSHVQKGGDEVILAMKAFVTGSKREGSGWRIGGVRVAGRSW